ncbi:MAG: hemerythrin domain-containing protein [Bdellovibrionota bacterium]
MSRARSKIANSAKVTKYIKGGAKKITEQIYDLLSMHPKDVVEAVKADHKALRNYLGVLKNTDEKMSVRRRAYDSFAALLKSHSVAEEKAVYVPSLKLTGREMHIKIAEGYVEHYIADTLMKRMESTDDALTWSAHANVLAENMEHHLKEEERDLLPLIRKAAPAKLNMDMLQEFFSLRAKSQKKITAKNAGALKD